jgi:hypothetical protein
VFRNDCDEQFAYPPQINILSPAHVAALTHLLLGTPMEDIELQALEAGS